MNRAFLKGFLCELEKQAKKAKKAPQEQQPQMMMMPAIPPDVLAALMGEPVEYEEPSMLQMLAPSVGLGAAGLGIGAAMGPGLGALKSRYGQPLANIKANLAAKMPAMPPLNPMRWFGKRAMAFLKQNRPKKVKEIYAALKREHPTMPAVMKARIAARQGKPGKQKQGPPYKGPLAKAAAKRKSDESREDPPGVAALILKAMRRLGSGTKDPRTVMAFESLSRNIPTNKRLY
jgi:hypothetical protein